MNKLTLSIVVLAVAIASLFTAGQVSAQSPTPQPLTPGYGRMGGRGFFAGTPAPNSTAGTSYGILHDAMMTVIAGKLGITVDSLNARLSAGETMAQIASAQGLTVDEFTTLLQDARSAAIDQAVQAGTITQEQADWMKQRGTGMMGGGYRGMGMGRYANQGCPMYNQINP
jgi:hypothetical protein